MQIMFDRGKNLTQKNELFGWEQKIVFSLATLAFLLGFVEKTGLGLGGVLMVVGVIGWGKKWANNYLRNK